MNKLFIVVAMVFLSQKNTNFSPEEMVLQNSAVEFDGDDLVLLYDFVMPHSNNREHVVTELETYGYTRKGGVGG